MTDTTYNGWTNRATWNVNLWLFNDQPRYEAMLRIFPKKNAGEESAHAMCRGFWGEKTPDNCFLDDVNWQEVAEAINEE